MGLTERLTYSSLIAIATYYIIKFLGLSTNIAIAIPLLILAVAFKSENKTNKSDKE